MHGLSMDESRDNTGKSYEMIVQGIFQAIQDQDQVATVIVERNKILQGMTVPHEIDVYWEFEKGGVLYKTIVQAKDWQTQVNQGQLILFKGVLDDLPGQARGVFVTRSGYQQGARDFANKHEIVLYELDEREKPPGIVLTTFGWGRYEAEVRSFKLQPKNSDQKPIEEVALGLNLTIFEPRWGSIEFQIDPTWRAQNSFGLAGKSRMTLTARPIGEIALYGPDHEPIGNVEAIVREEIVIMREAKITRKHVDHVFANDTFLGPDYTGIGLIKIKSVSFDVEVEQTFRPAHFNLTKFVQLVLREIPTNKIRTFLGPKDVFSS